MLSYVIVTVVVIAAVAGSLEYWFWKHGRLVAAHAAARGQRARASRRLALLAEAVASVGVILVLAGVSTAVGLRWLHLNGWERAAILAAAAACFLAAGSGVMRLARAAIQHLTGPGSAGRHVAEATVTGASLSKAALAGQRQARAALAGQRLAAVLWFVSVACMGAAAVTVTASGYRTSAPATILAAGATAAGYGAVLWARFRHELLMVATLAGVISTAVGVTMIATSGSTAWLTVALGLWLTGLAWMLLGSSYPQPLSTSMAMGAALALAAPAIAGHDYPWVYLLGITTAMAVMVASLPLRNVVILVFGSVALFGYITWAVFRYSDGSLGIAASLAVVGVLLLGLAIVTVRLGRAAQSPRPVPSQPAASAPRTHLLPAKADRDDADRDDADRDEDQRGQRHRSRRAHAA